MFSSYERRLTCSKATPGTTSSRRPPHGIAPRQRKLAKSEQLRAQFVERLPSTAWAGLSLADYVLGENNQDVVSYWMEFKDGLTPSMKAALTGTSLEVSAQQSFGGVVVGESTGRAYSTIRADLATVDTQSGRMVPVDIKYKLYDDKRFGAGDIYQLFSYAHALSGCDSTRNAGVLYSATTAVTGPALHIKPQTGVTGAHIRGAGFDVADIVDGLSAASLAVLRGVRDIVPDVIGPEGIN